MMTNKTPAKYFPKIMPVSVIGLVKSSSMVPVLLSSEKDFMVMAGIRMIKIMGLISKNGLKSAYPASKRLVSKEKNHKKSPFSTKKIPMKI